MTVLEIVEAKTLNTAISSADKQLAVLEVEQHIKNYCNIDEVPEELVFTWANMAVDLVRYQDVLNNRDAGAESDLVVHSGDVTSLKIGDTSVNLGSGSDADTENRALKSHRPNLDNLLMNYKQQLNRFRRMVW